MSSNEIMDLMHGYIRALKQINKIGLEEEDRYQIATLLKNAYLKVSTKMIGETNESS